MKNFKLAVIFVLIFVISSVTGAVEVFPVRLERDPFSRPKQVKQQRTIIKKTAEETTKLKLRATLISEQSSMANVNGVLLTSGDVIKGYRLLQIREGEAVFEKQGRKVVVNIDDTDSRKKKSDSKPKNENQNRIER